MSRSLVETCDFTFTSTNDSRVVRTRGTEVSWDDLKEEFHRVGRHCDPEALCYRTISERGPNLLAIVGNKSVYSRSNSVWQKYRSSSDIECRLTPHSKGT